MKECFKCGVVKRLDCFYKHKQMADGCLNKCKECTKADVSKNYNKNIDYYRSYEKTEKRKASRQERMIGSTKKYKESYPKKRKAHILVGNAIRSGKIKRSKNCESCHSSVNLHAHHDDYDKPMIIRWLCARCHVAWHKLNEAKNQI